MKPVPEIVQAVGPEGTVWHGGPVDQSTASLRVAAEGADILEVSRLLGATSHASPKGWRLRAPDALNQDLRSQIAWLLDQLTADLTKWVAVTSRWKVDLFCGLFLERSNRGVELDATTLRRLAERNVSIGFDIYAPDACGHNKSLERTREG
jgi:hypothetical protein